MDTSQLSIHLTPLFFLPLVVINLASFTQGSPSPSSRHNCNPHTKEGNGWNTLDGQPMILFAHRGEKVLLPEHTLPAYEVASILGADYVEPDLCLTKDDVLVCHHDLVLGKTTDVASHPEFDHLKRNGSGGDPADWYIRDFTLAQLKTLRIVQKRVGTRPSSFNGLFSIPTFTEYLSTIHRMIFQLNRTIGVVPELKDPEFHNKDRGAHFMEDQLLDVLENNGYSFQGNKGQGQDHHLQPFNCHAEVKAAGTDLVEIHTIPCPPVIVQSFEESALVYLHGRRESLELLQLVYDDPYMLTMEALRRIANFARYFSLWKYPLYMGVPQFLQATNTTWNETRVQNLGGFIPRHNFSHVIHQLGLRLIVYTVYDSRESKWNPLLSSSILAQPSHPPHDSGRRSKDGQGQRKRGTNMNTGDGEEVKRLELTALFQMGVDGIFVENVAESRQIMANFDLEFREKREETFQDCSSSSGPSSAPSLLLRPWPSDKICKNLLASPVLFLAASLTLSLRLSKLLV